MEQQADDVERIVRTYGDMLFRLCLVMLGVEQDAEDAVQDTVIRYMRRAPRFNGPDHEKAWLITTAKNRCRDVLRAKARHPQTGLEHLPEAAYQPPDSGIWDALMALPEKYRLVLTLYYVDEYRVGDIARIIRRTPSAVKMRLQKGRKLLEEAYRKENF